MSDYKQTEEIANFGGRVGGGYGFDGGGNLLWWVLILVLIFLFFFRKEDKHEGYGYGHGYGYNDGCCGVKGCRPAFYDESNFEEECHIKEKVDCQAEKTRALIEHKAEIEQMEKFQICLAEKAELKCKINQLENEKFNEVRFDQVKAQLARLQCDFDCQPKAAPCFIPTVQACTMGCPPFSCGESPRRCCD